MNVRRRRKPVTIENITITPEQQVKIDGWLNSKVIIHGKNNLIRKLLGGSCSLCAGIPTKKLIYDLQDAKLVEWYCDNCFDPVYVSQIGRTE